MKRSILAALLVIGSGWATNSWGEPIPAPPLPPPPPPFESDRPVGYEEVKLDTMLTRLSELLREGRSAEADAVIESRRRLQGLHGIRGVSWSFGHWERQYVWVDDQFGEYVHFAINDSRIRFFIPAICRNIVDRNSDAPTLGIFFLVSSDGGPIHFPPSGTHYFEVRCSNDVSLRMFYDYDDEQRYVTQIMMSVTPADRDD